MTEHILQFLQYGAPAEPIRSLSSSTTELFLPALALAASDSADLIPCLLPSLFSHRQLPRALVYAGLDYVAIAGAVVAAEEAEAAARIGDAAGAASGSASGGRRAGSGAAELDGGWENEDEAESLDECYAFEISDEGDRIRLAIISVRKRALEFSAKGPGAGVPEKDGPLHLENDEGSLWNNECCLPELLCFMPMAASRCPALLSADVLVKGLLSASNGCALLVAILANNPALVKSGALALASILGEHSNECKNRVGSSHAWDTNSNLETTGGNGSLSAFQSGPTPSLETSPHALATTLVLVHLARISPSFATVCREALVQTCALPELALQITVEITHDELQFLSRIIFSKEKSSQWILSVFGPTPKYGGIQEALTLLSSSSSKENVLPTQTKGSSKEQPAMIGVTTKVRDVLLADATATWKSQGWCGKLHAHLRLYCVLMQAGDLQPSHDEVDFWLRVLAKTVPDNGDEPGPSSETAFVSERTLQLGISFVCLVPGLSGPSTKAVLHACLANLLRAATASAPHGPSTLGTELAVWIAVQLLVSSFSDIAWLVRESLGVNVTIHPASVREMTDAAVAAGVLFDPGSVAAAAAALRPSASIPSSRKNRYLGLKCVELLLAHLLKSSGIFGRFPVDMSDTVMHYMCSAAEPIYPALPKIVQAFTELSVTAPRTRGGLSRFRMRPFSRAALVRAMSPGLLVLRSIFLNKTFSPDASPDNIRLLSLECSRDLQKQGRSEAQNAVKHTNEDPLATAALVTYYILYREHIVRSMGVSASFNTDTTSSGEGNDDGWWVDLLGDLPLRELLMYMEANWTAYENLLPQWLCVASVVFPERFTAQALLQDLERGSGSFETHVDGVSVTKDLDWVGPMESTLTEDSEADVPSSEHETHSCMEAGEPDAKREGSLSGIPGQAEGSSTHLMDVDEKVAQAQVDPKVERSAFKDEAQLPIKAVKVEEWIRSADLLSTENIIAIMNTAIENPLPALRVLTKMTENSGLKLVQDHKAAETPVFMSVGWRLEAAMMNALVPHLLDSSCPRCLQDQFCAWWRCLPTSASEHLIPVLWNLIRDPCVPSSGDSYGLVEDLKHGHYKQPRKGVPAEVTLSSSGLAEEPLKLLACDVKVFRCPLLSIVLDVLLQLLVANRQICRVAASDGGRETGIKREEVAAAMIAQDSAVCQILLESCLSREELDDEEWPGPLLEARSSICATICAMIYRSPLLLKLLNFQGYDLSLIPMMVEGVPVMVQSLEFINELLQQPQQERQVFAAVLTAHLISMHPGLPQSLTAAQQVVAQVTQMRAKVAGCAAYLEQVLGAVAQCASTFPSLAPQVVALIQSCAQAGGPLTPNGPPRDHALHTAALEAFKYLVQGKLLHGRPPPK